MICWIIFLICSAQPQQADSELPAGPVAPVAPVGPVVPAAPAGPVAPLGILKSKTWLGPPVTSMTAAAVPGSVVLV